VNLRALICAVFGHHDTVTIRPCGILFDVERRCSTCGRFDMETYVKHRDTTIGQWLPRPPGMAPARRRSSDPPPQAPNA
jgi:hypothetical protein